jgi:hypothetical protein
MDGLCNGSVAGALERADDGRRAWSGDLTVASCAAGEDGAFGVVDRVVDGVVGAVADFILWVYNNTAKSLFAAIVMHATINLSSSSPFIPRVGSHWDMLILAVLTWIVAIVLVGVWGPDTLAARRDSRGGG